MWKIVFQKLSSIQIKSNGTNLQFVFWYALVFNLWIAICVRRADAIFGIFQVMRNLSHIPERWKKKTKTNQKYGNESKNKKSNQIQWNFWEIPRKWMERNFIVNVWRKIRMFLEMEMVIEWMILVLIRNDVNGAIDSIWMVTSEMFSQNEWINDGMLCFC